MIDVKKETADRLKDVIPEDAVFQLFSVGLITERSAIRFLVVDEFTSKQVERGRKTEVKETIADKYCLNIETVQKYLAKK